MGYITGYKPDVDTSSISLVVRTSDFDPSGSSENGSSNLS